MPTVKRSEEAKKHAAQMSIEKRQTDSSRHIDSPDALHLHSAIFQRLQLTPDRELLDILVKS